MNLDATILPDDPDALKEMVFSLAESHAGTDRSAGGLLYFKKRLRPAGEGSSHLPTRKYAVNIDEAHSSQAGETATELKGVLGGAELIRKAREAAQEEGEAEMERLFQAMVKRKAGRFLEVVHMAMQRIAR